MCMLQVAGRPKVIVTADGVMRGTKPITLKKIAGGRHCLTLLPLFLAAFSAPDCHIAA